MLSILFASVAMAAPKFNLPVEVTCNGKPMQGIGGVACHQADDSRSSLKVKIPPTKGQLRVTDCGEDLTDDRNPDDFNIQIEKQGWWIFSRVVRVLSTTPSFSIPNKSYNDCGITVSVTAENTGVQTADIILESREMGSFAIVTCGGETFRIMKVATCKALSGGPIRIQSPDIGVIIAIGTSCGISAKSEVGKPLQLTVPEGRCVIDMALVPETAGPAIRSRLLVLGQSREAQELDNPLMVTDGGKRRIYRPIGANVISTEIYSGEKILWRSGPRDQDSYTIDPSADGGPWPTGSVACHTAYSRPLQSMSQNCYNLDNGKEVPYFFK